MTTPPQPEGGRGLVLVALAGLPGAGKSTVCAQLAQALAVPVHTTCLDGLQADEVARAGGSEWSPQAWHASRATAMSTVKHLLDTAAEPCILLVDDNAWLRSMRRQLYTLARDAPRPCALLVLHLDVAVQTAIARDATREGPSHVGAATIQKMQEHFESPGTCCTGCWEHRHTVRLDANDSSDALATLAVKAVQEALATPRFLVQRPDAAAATASRDADRALTAASLTHHADLWLRARVAEYVAEADGASKQSAAARANAARKHILGTLPSELPALEGDEEAKVEIEIWLAHQWRQSTAGR